MKTTAVRLHGTNDLRVETFELPAIAEDQILTRVVSDSICMSTYKAAVQGAEHKRVPADVAANPVMVGHELCGEILEVGARWREKFAPGQRFIIQPAINYKPVMEGHGAPGYSYPYTGGAATAMILPNEIMELDCLLPWEGESFYLGSLAEPISTIVGTFHAMYHTRKYVYTHEMDIKPGGAMAMLAAAGPMGLGAVDYAIHRDRRPRVLVVTDIDASRLARAKRLLPPEEARRHGVELHYLNTSDLPDAVQAIRSYSPEGFDDVFVFAPVPALFDQGREVLGYDGCLNFFAGPSRKDLYGSLNLYDLHYSAHHVVGTSGGGTEDLRESVELMAAGRINPSAMITHIGGITVVPETVLNLPKIPGGKKLIYTGLTIPLVALEELAMPAERSDAPGGPELWGDLAEIVAAHQGLWSAEAERHLLAHAPRVESGGTAG
ncbi:MAG: L-sorbose 1-phosphate reductase [Spirochaetaceae bacterium]|nr:MAG: L-sorbose 1-phosphate reductase [Spirochaetaceae bacterium]